MKFLWYLADDNEKELEDGGVAGQEGVRGRVQEPLLPKTLKN